MSDDHDEDVLEGEVEVVPGLDPVLEKQRSNEFTKAVQKLDGRGQRIVGQMLAGKRTTEVAERLDAGEVEVLSSGILTQTKRGVALKDGNSTGEAMKAALRLAGIDETHLANVLREGLKASKKVKAGKRLRNVPDYAIRIRYLELAHKLRGDLADAQSKAGAEETYEERLRLVMHRSAKDD